MVDDPKPDENENDLNPPAPSEKPETGASPQEETALEGSDADSLEAHAEADALSTDPAHEVDQHDEYHDDHHDDDYHDDHYHDDHYTAHDPNHDDGEADPNAMTFLEHLEELRQTILYCLYALGVGLTITLPFSNKILGWLKWPMEHGLTRRSKRLIEAGVKEAEKAKATVEAAGAQAVEAAAAVVEPVVVATHELAEAAVGGTNQVAEVATNLAVEVAETNLIAEVAATNLAESVERAATNVAEAAVVGTNKLDIAVQTVIHGGEPEMLYDLEKLLHVFDITGGIKLILTIGLWSGVILAAPIMIFFICQFIFPGLKPREKKIIVSTSGFAVALFALGVSICYFFTLPFAIDVMFGFTEWVGASTDVIRLNDYVIFCLKLMLGFGLAFELPEVLFVLGYLGLVNSKQLREKRRHVVVGLLFLAMMLTPPDPGTQLMLAVPLFFLFEITIWLIWAKEKSDARKEAAEA